MPLQFKTYLGEPLYEWLQRTSTRPRGGGPIERTKVRPGSWEGNRDVMSVSTSNGDSLVIVEGHTVTVQALGAGPPETIMDFEMNDPTSCERLQELLGVWQVEITRDTNSGGRGEG